jgi:predicted HTH domain antitoxin
LLVSLGKPYTLIRAMSITLQVPDSVARSLRLPEGEVEERLRSELALSLYGQGILSFGKAVELAAISRYAFANLLAHRGIPRHYGAEDLAEDLSYGRGD